MYKSGLQLGLTKKNFSLLPNFPLIWLDLLYCVCSNVDGLLGVVLLVVAQPPQPAPFLGVVLQVGAQRPQPASF